MSSSANANSVPSKIMFVPRYPNNMWLFLVIFQLNITWKPMAETASNNGVCRSFRGDSFFITSHRKFFHLANRVNESLVLPF